MGNLLGLVIGMVFASSMLTYRRACKGAAWFTGVFRQRTRLAKRA